LRFPEFSEEWKKERLKNKCSFFSGGTPSSTNKAYYDGDIPFIRSGEIASDSTDLFLSESGLNNSSAKIVEKGDLLLALYGATSGQIAISQIKGAINQAILCIRSPYDKFFLKSAWEKRVDKILQAYLQGGQGNLSAEIVKNLSFYFPSLQEQRKIGQLIILIDERISTQIRIIDKLQSLMKGLAEHLTAFTPNIKIADCLNCHSSILQENQVKNEGNYKVYGANGICGYNDSPAILEDAILIVKDGSGVGNVSYASGEYSVIGTSNYLTAKSGYSLKYLYFCLMIFNFVPYRTGMAIPHIYFKDYGKALIYCPSLDKQIQIATLLSKIECKIEAEKTITDSYQQQKRFLLQSMFI